MMISMSNSRLHTISNTVIIWISDKDKWLNSLMSLLVINWWNDYTLPGVDLNDYLTKEVIQ